MYLLIAVAMEGYLPQREPICGDWYYLKFDTIHDAYVAAKNHMMNHKFIESVEVVNRDGRKVAVFYRDVINS